MKPYYEDGKVTIFHADSDADRWPDADLTFTDPPADHLGPALRAGNAPVLAITPFPFYLPGLPRTMGRLDYRGAMAAGYPLSRWLPCLVYTTADRIWIPDETWHPFTAAATVHPQGKPLDVIEWFLSRLPGDVVLDPFMGSGTTLVAAVRQGRRAIGIEIEERWCEMAAKRLEREKVNA